PSRDGRAGLDSRDPRRAQFGLSLLIGTGRPDVQSLARRDERFAHQRLIVLAGPPARALAAAIALDHGAREPAPAGDADALDRSAGGDEYPAEPAGLAIGKGRKARFAERFVGLIAGQDMPDIVRVALAPAEPGVGMLRSLGDALGRGKFDQPLCGIA